jgi:hypothetical protein
LILHGTISKVRGGPRFADPDAHSLKIDVQTPIDALVLQNHLRVSSPEEPK